MSSQIGGILVKTKCCVKFVDHGISSSDGASAAHVNYHDMRHQLNSKRGSARLKHLIFDFETAPTISTAGWFSSAILVPILGLSLALSATPCGHIVCWHATRNLENNM